MRFPALKAHAPSVARVTFAATAALIVFTAVSAFTGSNLAFARSADGREKPYSIRLRTTKDADLTVLHVVITDNATGDVLATPSVKLDSTRTAFTRTTVGDNDIEMDVRPGSNDKTTLTVRIIKNGEVLQQSTMMLVPNTDDPTRVYTGKAISLDLKDADLRQVLGLFGKITGLQMDIDPDVQGKVTVSWHDVPWDEAFDTLVKEQGLTWSVHDSVAHVSKK